MPVQNVASEYSLWDTSTGVVQLGNGTHTNSSVPVTVPVGS